MPIMYDDYGDARKLRLADEAKKIRADELFNTRFGQAVEALRTIENMASVGLKPFPAGWMQAAGAGSPPFADANDIEQLLLYADGKLMGEAPLPAVISFVENHKSTLEAFVVADTHRSTFAGMAYNLRFKDKKDLPLQFGVDDDALQFPAQAIKYFDAHATEFAAHMAKKPESTNDRAWIKEFAKQYVTSLLRGEAHEGPGGGTPHADRLSKPKPESPAHGF